MRLRDAFFLFGLFWFVERVVRGGKREGGPDLRREGTDTEKRRKKKNTPPWLEKMKIEKS